MTTSRTSTTTQANNDYKAFPGRTEAAETVLQECLFLLIVIEGLPIYQSIYTSYNNSYVRGVARFIQILKPYILHEPALKRFCF